MLIIACIGARLLSELRKIGKNVRDKIQNQLKQKREKLFIEIKKTLRITVMKSKKENSL